MKGGLAILLTLLEAFERSPLKESLGWEILITPDEEIGSPGSTKLYCEAAKRHHLALIFEPAFSDGAFVNERKGSSNLTIAFHGRSAHVGRDFSNGRSAVFPLAELVVEIQNLQKEGDTAINVADLYSSGPVNIVPDIASCSINIRSSDAETLKKAVEQIQATAERYADIAEVECRCLQDSFRPPKPFDASTAHLFAAYRQCAEELQIPFECRSTGGVCDGNTLANAGLPTLDTAGVIGGGLHTDSEYLLKSSLTERASLAALFLFKLASREIILPLKAL
jgi:glutamate carboxypeptidase